MFFLLIQIQTNLHDPKGRDLYFKTSNLPNVSKLRGILIYISNTFSSVRAYFGIPAHTDCVRSGRQQLMLILALKERDKCVQRLEAAKVKRQII